jgi:hypothetical protein
MAPLGLVLLLEQGVEAEAFGRRRREGERGRHELLRPRGGGQGLGAHDDHLPLRGHRVVLRQAVQEPAGGAVLAEPACEVHAGPPRGGRGHLVVAQREAAAVAAARRRPALELLGVERVGAAVKRRLVGGERREVVASSSRAREPPGRAEPGRRRGRGLGGEVGARAGDDGVEQVLGAEGEADQVLDAVVLDEEQAHDLGGVLRVQRAHPVEHHLGGLPGVHGVRPSQEVVRFLKGRRGKGGGEKRRITGRGAGARL